MKEITEDLIAETWCRDLLTMLSGGAGGHLKPMNLYSEWISNVVWVQRQIAGQML